jgi:hypothetical protein
MWLHQRHTTVVLPGSPRSTVELECLTDPHADPANGIGGATLELTNVQNCIGCSARSSGLDNVSGPLVLLVQAGRRPGMAQVLMMTLHWTRHVIRRNASFLSCYCCGVVSPTIWSASYGSLSDRREERPDHGVYPIPLGRFP